MADQTTLFRRVDYEVGYLLQSIEVGDIALPDIQRPFVWPATKVRDLLDSMYRGFPIGYLLFWSNPVVEGVTQVQIGQDSKHVGVANRLIIDGQQRLTSLYSVFRGRKVLNRSYQPVKLGIAFRPRDGRFEVADAAVRRVRSSSPMSRRSWGPRDQRMDSSTVSSSDCECAALSMQENRNG